MFYSIFILSVIFIFQLTFAHASSEKQFSIMSYNVENLFDTIHDEGKEDYEMLPFQLKKTIYLEEVQRVCAKYNVNKVETIRTKECLVSDWNYHIYIQKIKNLVSVIVSYNSNSHGMKGADIVILPEIENLRVMKDFLSESKKYGYKYAEILEDRDQRGIDVGILSKFPIVEKKLIRPIDAVSSDAIKRGLYQYDVMIDNYRIAVIGNHWPSLNNDLSKRKLMAAFFISTIDKMPNKSMVVSIGDFNALDDENPSVINDVLIKNVDAKHEALKLKTKVFPGSHKHQGQWKGLDRIIIPKKYLKSNFKIVPLFETFRVLVDAKLLSPWPVDFNSSYFTSIQHKKLSESDLERLVPLRYDAKRGLGYSDHLPIVMEFKIQ